MRYKLLQKNFPICFPILSICLLFCVFLCLAVQVYQLDNHWTLNHFYYPTNALNYMKLRDENLLFVSFKRQLKITPTCFGSCAIHHQGVLSCAGLKLLLVVHRYFSCAWSVFGSVILNLRCLCTVVHTHRHTDQAHEKYLWNTKCNFSQAQLSIPWWWIAHDPKHVGVTFNFLLKLTQRRF